MGETYVLDRVLRARWLLGFDQFPEVVKVSIPESLAAIIDGLIRDRKG